MTFRRFWFNNFQKEKPKKEKSNRVKSTSKILPAFVNVFGK